MKPFSVNRTSDSPTLDRRIELALLVVILLAAAFLRLWQLDSLPPGFTHDEAGHGQDAIAILHGARPLYETVGYGREPLYDYVVATAMAVLGRTDYLTVRWVSALCGLLTIVVAYLWIRRAFGVWEAILTCAWLAGSFWAISASREALRSVLLPVLLAAAVYAWWRGVSPHPNPPPLAGEGREGVAPPAGEGRVRVIWFALSGVFIAATLWTYMAARVTWVLFLALPIFLLITDRARFKRHWPDMLLTLGVAAVLAAPMFIWLGQHPGAEQRFNQLGQPLQLLATGDVREILANSLQAMGMFTVRADDLWMYNLPGRPWLGLVDGVLFYAGLAVAVWRWRRPQYALALMWLVVGMFPSLITGVSASATRAIAILPVLYLFSAIAITTLFQIFKSASRKTVSLHHPFGSTFGRQGRLVTLSPSLLVSLSVVVVSLVVIGNGVQTYRDYFGTWGNARDVRVAYHTNLFEIAHDLDRASITPGATVVLSSIYPGRYHDPYAMDLILARRDLSLRWVDGGSPLSANGALVFPGGTVRLIVPALAPLDPALAQAIAPPYARLVESHLLRPDDFNPRFDVYEWDSTAGLKALLAQSIPPATAGGTEGGADLGHTIALIGYELSSQAAAPGDEIALVTYWRILSQPNPELDTVLFTHLLSPGGNPPVVAQQDHLDAPTWNWHAGEVFAQVHRFKIGSNVAEGLYPLEVGAYTRPGPSPIDPNPPTTRLALYVNGQAVDDRILLPSVQVKR